MGISSMFLGLNTARKMYPTGGTASSARPDIPNARGLDALAEAARKHTPPISSPDSASAATRSDPRALTGAGSMSAKCARMKNQPAIQ